MMRYDVNEIVKLTNNLTETILLDDEIRLGFQDHFRLIEANNRLTEVIFNHQNSSDKSLERFDELINKIMDNATGETAAIVQSENTDNILDGIAEALNQQGAELTYRFQQLRMHQAIFNASHNALIVVNEGLELIMQNPSAQELFGMRKGAKPLYPIFEGQAMPSTHSRELRSQDSRILMVNSSLGKIPAHVNFVPFMPENESDAYMLVSIKALDEKDQDRLLELHQQSADNLYASQHAKEADSGAEAVVAQIRKIRETKEYSQEYMGVKLGLTARGYSKIENGESRLTVKHLYQIASILEVELSELLQTDFRHPLKDQMPNNAISASDMLVSLYEDRVMHLEEEIKFLRDRLKNCEGS